MAARPDRSLLPSRAEIFEYWKDRFPEIGRFIDWGEPSCWGCGFHYGDKFDVRSSDASWEAILESWNRIPLQRCHIVPKGLGGTDTVNNLFLMCRECHDLAPNTPFPELFFQWVRAQSWSQRENARIREAMRAFSVSDDDQKELTSVFESVGFRDWLNGKIGLHRPQSNYASRSWRLTPTTLVGLAVHFRRQEMRTTYSMQPTGGNPLAVD